MEDTAVTDHRVLLIGMHAETTYRIKVVSATEDGDGISVAKTSYETEALPEIVLPVTPGLEGAAFSNAAWRLTNVHDFASSPRPPAVAVMYDDYGLPVWYYVNGALSSRRGDLDVRLLENEHLLVGPTDVAPPVEVDLAGNILWQGPPPEGDEIRHHHFGKTRDGNYVGIRHRPVGEMQWDFRSTSPLLRELAAI